MINPDTFMDNIRDESLKYCLGFTLVIGLALLYAGIWSLNSGITPAKIIVSSMRSGIWIACGFFLAGPALSASLAKRSYTVASWTLCASVAAGIFALLTNTSNATFVLAFLLPIVFSVFLFEWRQALLFLALLLVPTLYLYANSFEFNRNPNRRPGTTRGPGLHNNFLTINGQRFVLNHRMVFGKIQNSPP